MIYSIALMPLAAIHIAVIVLVVESGDRVGIV